MVGQKKDSREYLKRASQYYRLIGSADSECDTIPGRQCMACHFFLQKLFEDTSIYLKSIDEYFRDSDEFNWNFGITRCELGQFKEAEENFLKVEDPRMTKTPTYLSWLTRCYIYNGKPNFAWELYLNSDLNEYMKDIIQLIANDCYLTGNFWYSAKAFDILERLDPNTQYFQAKKGACIGALQQVVAGKRNKDTISDIIKLLIKSKNEEAVRVATVMKNYAMKIGVNITPDIFL